MINIEKLLIENENVENYKINSTRTESYELFFVQSNLETVRATDTESVTVTVYRNHNGKKGQASFKIYASTTESEAKEKICDAAQKALLISNEDYALPADETLDSAIKSNFADYEPKELASLMAKAVFSADMLKKGSINALEIFINKLYISVKNNCGIDKREIKYNAMIEAIPTWTDGESVELYEAIRVSDFDFDAIKAEIERKMRYVKDRGCAKAPSHQIKCPVLLTSHELSELFSEIAYALDYSSVYAHSNPYFEGDYIQKAPENDKINISMRAQIGGSVASALFDADGTTLVDTKIISNGQVCSYFGNHRFAQYLKKPTTGALPCIEVECGSLDEKTLASAPYFECVSMSGLQVDIFNDYIGGEVRLAYYFDGKEKTPVTGISISGKLSSALDSVKLSTASQLCGRYSGPKYALFEGIEIV